MAVFTSGVVAPRGPPVDQAVRQAAGPAWPLRPLALPLTTREGSSGITGDRDVSDDLSAGTLGLAGVAGPKSDQVGA
jgi:hypothetical protein